MSVPPFVVAVLLLSVAFCLPQRRGRCIHDSVEIQRLFFHHGMDMSIPYADSSNNNNHRGFLATAIGSIRIVIRTPDLYDETKYCTNTSVSRPDFKGNILPCSSVADVFTSTKRDILLNKVLPAAVAKLGSILSVVQRSSNIVVPSGTCTYPTIPLSDQTTGVPASDYVLYVTAGKTDADVLAWAGACGLEGGSSGRPIIGTANFGPAHIQWDTNNTNINNQQIQTATHELIHALGFSSQFFDNSFFVSGAAPVVENATLRGKETKIIVTPKVKEHVRSYFQCLTLRGAELESGRSHWEKQTYNGELMTASGGTQLSALTLRLLQDCGYYTVDVSRAEPMVWGAREGCDFINKKCNVTTKFWCHTLDSAEELCTYDSKAIGGCGVKNYATNLPAEFQYFTDPKVGGLDSFMDYCPTVVAAMVCTDNVSLVGDQADKGYYFGRNSRCVTTSNLIREGLSSTNYGTKRCLRLRCADGRRVQFKLGDSEWQSCPEQGGWAAVPAGWSGNVSCPTVAEICDVELYEKMGTYTDSGTLATTLTLSENNSLSSTWSASQTVSKTLFVSDTVTLSLVPTNTQTLTVTSTVTLLATSTWTSTLSISYTATMTLGSTETKLVTLSATMTETVEPTPTLTWPRGQQVYIDGRDVIEGNSIRYREDDAPRVTVRIRGYSKGFIPPAQFYSCFVVNSTSKALSHYLPDLLPRRSFSLAIDNRGILGKLSIDFVQLKDFGLAEKTNFTLFLSRSCLIVPQREELDPLTFYITPTSFSTFVPETLAAAAEITGATSAIASALIVQSGALFSITGEISLLTDIAFSCRHADVGVKPSFAIHPFQFEFSSASPLGYAAAVSTMNATVAFLVLGFHFIAALVMSIVKKCPLARAQALVKFPSYSLLPSYALLYGFCWGILHIFCHAEENYDALGVIALFLCWVPFVVATAATFWPLNDAVWRPREVLLGRAGIGGLTRSIQSLFSKDVLGLWANSSKSTRFVVERFGTVFTEFSFGHRRFTLVVFLVFTVVVGSLHGSMNRIKCRDMVIVLLIFAVARAAAMVFIRPFRFTSVNYIMSVFFILETVALIMALLHEELRLTVFSGISQIFVMLACAVLLLKATKELYKPLAAATKYRSGLQGNAEPLMQVEMSGRSPSPRHESEREPAPILVTPTRSLLSPSPQRRAKEMGVYEQEKTFIDAGSPSRPILPVPQRRVDPGSVVTFGGKRYVKASSPPRVPSPRALVAAGSPLRGTSAVRFDRSPSKEEQNPFGNEQQSVNAPTYLPMHVANSPPSFRPPPVPLTGLQSMFDEGFGGIPHDDMLDTIGGGDTEAIMWEDLNPYEGPALENPMRFL